LAAEAQISKTTEVGPLTFRNTVRCFIKHMSISNESNGSVGSVGSVGSGGSVGSVGSGGSGGSSGRDDRSEEWTQSACWKKRKRRDSFVQCNCEIASYFYLLVTKPLLVAIFIET
jgi:hypothetical protein